MERRNDEVTQNSYPGDKETNERCDDYIQIFKELLYESVVAIVITE